MYYSLKFNRSGNKSCIHYSKRRKLYLHNRCEEYFKTKIDDKPDWRDQVYAIYWTRQNVGEKTKIWKDSNWSWNKYVYLNVARFLHNNIILSWEFPGLNISTAISFPNFLPNSLAHECNGFTKKLHACIKHNLTTFV